MIEVDAYTPVFKLVELSSRGVEEKVYVEARRVVLRIISSQLEILNGRIISYYFRKAIRTGVWRKLRGESRALLLAVSKWGGVIKSNTLRSILIDLLTEIEISSFKGKALLYGVIVAFNHARELLSNPVRSITRLLTLGIQYLNLPCVFRVYG